MARRKMWQLIGDVLDHLSRCVLRYRRTVCTVPYVYYMLLYEVVLMIKDLCRWSENHWLIVNG